MTHRERIEALLNGEKPDRMPVSFWRHFYESESTAEQLAEAMVGFQERFDWDMMKINSRASYYVEDWGGEYSYTGIEHDHPTRIECAVNLATMKLECFTGLERTISAVPLDFSSATIPIDTSTTPMASSPETES